MKPHRMEAFSDGVLAIIITIMVLELKAPESASFHAVLERLPVFLSYIFSFVYLGIYWNNHHHLLQATKQINGKILWANLHLLFWLSIIPFTTSWLGEHYTDFAPVMLYGIVLLMCAIAYLILQNTILSQNESNAVLNKAIGKDIKGKASNIIYVAGILLTLVNTWIALVCYIVVAIMWIVPDKRIEKNIDRVVSE